MKIFNSILLSLLFLFNLSASKESTTEGKLSDVERSLLRADIEGRRASLFKYKTAIANLLRPFWKSVQEKKNTEMIEKFRNFATLADNLRVDSSDKDFIQVDTKLQELMNSIRHVKNQ